MVQAVTHSYNREDDERTNLNYVDRRVHSSCARDTSETNIGDGKREEGTEDQHEQRTGYCIVKRVRPDRSDHIADDERRHPDHQSRINPVVEMTSPTHNELRNSRKLICLCLA